MSAEGQGGDGVRAFNSNGAMTVEVQSATGLDGNGVYAWNFGSGGTQVASGSAYGTGVDNGPNGIGGRGVLLIDQGAGDAVFSGLAGGSFVGSVEGVLVSNQGGGDLALYLGASSTAEGGSEAGARAVNYEGGSSCRR